MITRCTGVRLVLRTQRAFRSVQKPCMHRTNFTPVSADFSQCTEAVHAQHKFHSSFYHFSDALCGLHSNREHQVSNHFASHLLLENAFRWVCFFRLASCAGVKIIIDSIIIWVLLQFVLAWVATCMVQ